MSKASRNIGFPPTVFERPSMGFGEFGSSSARDGSRPRSNWPTSSDCYFVMVAVSSPGTMSSFIATITSDSVS